MLILIELRKNLTLTIYIKMVRLVWHPNTHYFWEAVGKSHSAPAAVAALTEIRSASTWVPFPKEALG